MLLCMYAHVDYVHYSISLADFTLSARPLHTASHLRYIGVVGQSTEPIDYHCIPVVLVVGSVL